MTRFPQGWFEVQERLHEEKGYLEGVWLAIWFVGPFISDDLQLDKNEDGTYNDTLSNIDTEHLCFEIDFYADMETELDYVNSMWIHGVRVPHIFELAHELYTFLSQKTTWEEMLAGLKEHFQTEPPQEVKDLFVPLSSYFDE